MTTTETSPSTDRLIWASLLAVMAAALITDQARANLHAEARAEAAAVALIDRPLTAAGWCRMHLDVLAGDDAIGFGLRLHEVSALPGVEQPSTTGTRGSRNVDAPR